MSQDLSGFSMWDLYRGELESHSATLDAGLLALEERLDDTDRIKALMRAAHSIKGAARVVQHSLAVEVAHAMEDRLVAAQEGRLPLTGDAIQRLLEGVDLLKRLSPEDESERDARVAAAGSDAARLVRDLQNAPAPATAPAASVEVRPAPVAPTMPASVGGAPPVAPPTASPPGAPGSAGAQAAPDVSEQATSGDRTIRLTAQTVNRLVGLTGEAVVATRWLTPFSKRLIDLKRQVTEVAERLERLEAVLTPHHLGLEVDQAVNDIQDRLERTRADLTEHFAVLEGFALRQESLADRLHREVIQTRMRPFSEVAESFPRLVRDLARELGKRVRFEVDGKRTEVDRDVAGLLDAPLIHLLRNAVDHGIEPPGERTEAGKPEVGTIRLGAGHRAGMLRVEVSDDGRGADLPALRRKIAERGLTDPSTVERLSDDEVLSFLFLPGFSTAVRVTEVSGRGVGLDVVLETMKAMGGRVHVTNRPGRGLTFAFDLPLTLSVLQALIVEIAGEPYAFPVTRIERADERPRTEISTVEGREYLTLQLLRDGSAGARHGGSPLEEHHVGLVTGRQILGIGDAAPASAAVSVVVIRDGPHLYGLVVDRIVGEQSVVVRPLDPRLGKVRDVTAAALMVDGTPLLVADADDMIRSIEQILTGGRLAPLGGAVPESAGRKRVLVVDDSITVREIERQLLEKHGYGVDVAVDGMDGWNAVRTGHYDLVVSDVDMPRLDGIELVKRIRGDRRYAHVPVMIVSYKDREEDRLRGLDAGASYYLPKSSFQDDRFLTAVNELIGEAGSA